MRLLGAVVTTPIAQAGSARDGSPLALALLFPDVSQDSCHPTLIAFFHEPSWLDDPRHFFFA
jgi:hypothetical protein